MHYSRTPVRKRPPKMRILSGPLREVVAYYNRTTGCLFREDVQTQHASDPFESKTGLDSGFSNWIPVFVSKTWILDSNS